MHRDELTKSALKDIDSRIAQCKAVLHLYVVERKEACAALISHADSVLAGAKVGPASYEIVGSGVARRIADEAFLAIINWDEPDPGSPGLDGSTRAPVL